MAESSYLIVGLGNPGKRYEKTRHNVGFMLIDYLARKNKLKFYESRWQSQYAEGVLWQARLFLLKPETYMNLSGAAVAAAADHYNLQASRILVIHDDIDLPIARVKISSQGGSGGHRGLQSLIDSLQSNIFPRVKVGIGRPEAGIPVEQYVLSDFTEVEEQLLGEKTSLIEKGISVFVKEGVNAAMNEVNGIRD